jgi:tRNA threonylcarbamoyladenosine biosynthesis protein TsaB
VTVAFSTSSSLASVALFSESGALLWSGDGPSAQRASSVCLDLLADGFKATGRSLGEVRLFLADLGPGSFTGVRVGVTLAKTLAFACSARTGGADSFDLIDPGRTVVLPSRRGEYFVRRPGSPPERNLEPPDDPFRGYGAGAADGWEYPHAARFEALLSKILPSDPQELLPAYLIEPSISTPKKPYGVATGEPHAR